MNESIVFFSFLRFWHEILFFLFRIFSFFLPISFFDAFRFEEMDSAQPHTHTHWTPAKRCQTKSLYNWKTKRKGWICHSRLKIQLSIFHTISHPQFHFNANFLLFRKENFPLNKIPTKPTKHPKNEEVTQPKEEMAKRKIIFWCLHRFPCRTSLACYSSFWRCVCACSAVRSIQWCVRSVRFIFPKTKLSAISFLFFNSFIYFVED